MAEPGDGAHLRLEVLELFGAAALADAPDGQRGAVAEHGLVHDAGTRGAEDVGRRLEQRLHLELAVAVDRHQRRRRGGRLLLLLGQVVLLAAVLLRGAPADEASPLLEALLVGGLAVRRRGVLGAVRAVVPTANAAPRRRGRLLFFASGDVERLDYAAVETSRALLLQVQRRRRVLLPTLPPLLPDVVRVHEQHEEEADAGDVPDDDGHNGRGTKLILLARRLPLGLRRGASGVLGDGRERRRRVGGVGRLRQRRRDRARLLQRRPAQVRVALVRRRRLRGKRAGLWDRAGEVVPRQVHRRVRGDDGGQLGRHSAGELVGRNVEEAECGPTEVRRERAVEVVVAQVNKLQRPEASDGELTGEVVAGEPQRKEARQPAQRGGEAARERVAREVELLQAARIGRRRVRELA
uniref:Uncharacterized protein n=1 Tax=Zea mays TaxID=4577 RepID=C4J482_MAIZE|nr:unknown [Zea mays]ACR36099.1 unknown [Zea mays]